jgi:hypothetical protein
MRGVAGSYEQLRGFEARPYVIREIRAQREQFWERAIGLVVVDEEPNQFQANLAARVGSLSWPWRV